MQLKDARDGGHGNPVTLIPIQHRMSLLSCFNGYAVAELLPNMWSAFHCR
jgi:hypothetical protein